jgi:hypothetical protein
MPFSVIANQGLDVARFGESREVLRARLGAHDSFRRTPDASPTDRFLHLGLFLDFDDSEKLNLIEISPPAEVEYEGVSLLARDYHQVISELGSRGCAGAEDDSGIEFRDHGFSLFNPAPEEDDSEVEGVTLFSPGYYG